jgi:transposase
MSTSFLYHGFGLVGYDYVCTRYIGGAVIFSIKQNYRELQGQYP